MFLLLKEGGFIKKVNIVKSSRDFEKIINNGIKKHNKSFSIYYQPNNLKYSRYGISVGKKLGNAVYRNKYKRKLRAIIDNNSIKNDCVVGYDYIIILRRDAKDSSYAALEKDYISIITNIRKEI